MVLCTLLCRRPVPVCFRLARPIRITCWLPGLILCLTRFPPLNVVSSAETSFDAIPNVAVNREGARVFPNLSL